MGYLIGFIIGTFMKAGILHVVGLAFGLHLPFQYCCVASLIVRLYIFVIDSIRVTLEEGDNAKQHNS